MVSSLHLLMTPVCAMQPSQVVRRPAREVSGDITAQPTSNMAASTTAAFQSPDELTHAFAKGSKLQSGGLTGGQQQQHSIPSLQPYTSPMGDQYAVSAHEIIEAKDAQPASSDATSQDKIPAGMMVTPRSQFKASSGGTPTSPAQSISALPSSTDPSAASSTASGALPGDVQRLACLQQLVREGKERMLIQELTPPAGSTTEAGLTAAFDAYHLLTWQLQPLLWHPVTPMATNRHIDMTATPLTDDQPEIPASARSTSLSGTAPLLGASSKGTFRRGQPVCSAMALLLCKQRLEVHSSVELAYHVKARQVNLRLLDLACSVTGRVFGQEGFGHTPFQVTIAATPPSALKGRARCLEPLVRLTLHASRSTGAGELSAFLQNPVGAQVQAITL